jgi:hypothetical protein
VACLGMWRDWSDANEEWLVMIQGLPEVFVGVIRHFGGGVVIVHDSDFLWVVPVAVDMLESWIIVLICVLRNKQILHENSRPKRQRSTTYLLLLSSPWR